MRLSPTPWRRKRKAADLLAFANYREFPSPDVRGIL
jgi:hypothetical protein